MADSAFTIGGGALAVLGLAMLCFALLHDRARGRLRCPKCWYDLTGSPVEAGSITCSECGFTPKHGRQLLKTRRRWRTALLAVILLAMGAAAAISPTVSRDGWLRVVPTTALIFAFPDLLESMPDATAELADRLEENRAWAWQWRWLLTKSDDARIPHADVEFIVRSRWPDDLPLHCMATLSTSSDFDAWTQRLPVRARLVSLFDPGSAPVPLELGSRFAGFFLPTQFGPTEVELGVPPSGAEQLQIALVIELHRNSSWQRIYERVFTLDVQVGGSLDEHIVLDASDDSSQYIKIAHGFDLRSTHLSVVQLPHARTLERLQKFKQLAAPAAVELRRDGEYVASWRIWLTGEPEELSKSTWWTARRDTIDSFRLPSHLRGSKRPFGTLEYEEFAWSVHVRGDPTRALLNTKAEAAWAGEFTAPLHLLESPSISAYRSWAAPTD